MSKMIKRLIATGMASLLIAASFAGCAGSGNSADAKVFRIGGLGPTSGDNASYGTSVKQGAQTAIDEINKAGGVNGMKLELVFQDDQADPTVATSAYNKLVDSHIDALLGGTTSGATVAITDLTNQDGILQITPSASQKEATQYDNAFRICFTDPVQGQTMADYIVDKLGKKNVAVLYDNSNDYSKGITDAFVAELAKKGGTVVAKESFTAGDKDFKTQLTKIKAKNPEVMFMPFYYQEIAYVVKQAKEVGLNVPYIGCDGWDGILPLIQDNVGLVEGAKFLTPFVANDTDEKIQNFVKLYDAQYKATPDQFAADAYDGVYAIKLAIEKAGIKDTSDKKANSKALIAAMTEIEVDGLTGKMTFDKTGEPNKSAKIVEIKNGAYVALKD